MEIWEARSHARKNNLNIFYLKNMRLPFMEIWEVRSRGRKNNLNIFCLRKCACLTSKKLDFADKIENCMEIWKEPRVKKQFEHLLFKKCACPTSEKLAFADKIKKFMEIWEARSHARKNNLNIFYLKNMRLPFMEIWEVRSRGRKNNLNIFCLRKCACPTSKKLAFADKIKTFMEIWEVRSQEPGTKKQFEHLLFENMRLPNLQKARSCRQNWKTHANLWSQEPGTKKQFEHFLF